MVRTQVQLHEEQLRELRARALAQNVSVSELIRRAVDLMVLADSLPSAKQRRRRALAAAGRFSSGRSDIAEHHDAYLAEAFGS